MRLAVLNDDNICTGYKNVMKMINDGKHIEIDNEDYLFRKYENGRWSEEKFYPVVEPQTTLDEQIYAENLYQTALLEMQALGGM